MKYIDPLNPYTGEVSTLAILENEKNGFTRFPKYMGDVFGSNQIDICGICNVPFRRGVRKGDICDECKNIS